MSRLVGEGRVKGSIGPVSDGMRVTRARLTQNIVTHGGKYDDVVYFLVSVFSNYKHTMELRFSRH